MINELKNVPELRFSNFCDEWVNYKLGEIVDIRGRIGFRGYTKSDIINKEDGGVLTFSPTNIIYNKLKNTVHDTYITKEKYEESPEIMVKTGDILFVKTGSTLGKSTLVANLNEEATVNPQIVVMRVKVFFHQKFTSTYLTLNKILRQVAQTRIGGAIPTLTESEIKKFQVSFPVYEEQQKIGEFFSKLDRQIELEEQKLAKLEEQKKGYMQQIFSRQFLFENEKGDTDYSWRNFKIKDIFSKIESGNRLPKTNLVEGNIPYVIAQTTNNGVFMHISEDTLDYHKNKLKLFKKGSITISIDNPEAMFIQEMDFFTSNVMRVIHNENLKRGSHIFIMESLKKLTQSYNWSVKFSGPIIMDSTVKFPVYNDNKVNWNVVNKIGDFFNTFEIRINRQSDKIKLLEERKKGLLQKMFV